MTKHLETELAIVRSILRTGLDAVDYKHFKQREQELMAEKSTVQS